MNLFSFVLGRDRSGTYSAVSESCGDLPVFCSDMAQLHPPYVLEAAATDVKERSNDPKRLVKLAK